MVHKVYRRLLPAMVQQRPYSSANNAHRHYSTAYALTPQRSHSSLSPPMAGSKELATQNQYCRYQSSSSSSDNSSSFAKSSSKSEIASQNENSNNKYTIKQANEINIQDRVKIIPLGDGIVHVQLFRPNKLNSLDMPMFEAIADAASRLKNDVELKKGLRAVILSGEGRAFCTQFVSIMLYYLKT